MFLTGDLSWQQKVAVLVDFLMHIALSHTCETKRIFLPSDL
jgi:hypothetical protein